MLYFETNGYLLTCLIIVGLCAIYWKYYFYKNQKPKISKKTPISVNYHFSRKCNYQCGFCFHRAKNSYILSLEDAKKGLLKLKEAGMRKINFAGGEPFLYPKFLGELVMYCKDVLKLESVSIISNGSLIKESWMNKYSMYLDILGISCDSFIEETNVKIGRGTGKHVENIFKIRDLCYKYNIKFKLNTVVCKYNFMEDMNEAIARLAPFRWKVFQVLIVQTENDGKNNSLRNATQFEITNEEYQSFVKRHENQTCLIKEPNLVMQSSYLILDEKMRFLDKCNDKGYIMSDSILDVCIEKALSQINWDVKSFEERQGEYDWSKEFSSSSSDCLKDTNLDW